MRMETVVGRGGEELCTNNRTHAASAPHQRGPNCQLRRKPETRALVAVGEGRPVTVTGFHRLRVLAASSWELPLNTPSGFLWSWNPPSSPDRREGAGVPSPVRDLKKRES